MRVVLVGPPDERARLRRALDGTGVVIAGEVATLAAARAAALDADAFVTAAGPPERAAMTARDADEPTESLTPRETQVLELLAEGLSNKAIAARLGISDQTVKFHVASIYGKLGASNRTEAVRRALRRGLLTL
jgi:DNA-binding NarL/FixJ family response regulator